MIDISTIDPKELAERLCNSMDRDFGYRIAWDMGMDPATINALSDDILMEMARAYAAAPKPKETRCHECGQDLPE